MIDYDREDVACHLCFQDKKLLQWIKEEGTRGGPCPWCEFVPAVHTAGGIMSLNFISRLNALADFEVFLTNSDSGVWKRENVKLTRLTAEPIHRPFR